jgi:hypothetical protein
MYERVEAELGIKSYVGTPEDMAEATARIYFTDASNSERGPSPSSSRN